MSTTLYWTNKPSGRDFGMLSAITCSSWLPDIQYLSMCRVFLACIHGQHIHITLLYSIVIYHSIIWRLLNKPWYPGNCQAWLLISWQWGNQKPCQKSVLTNMDCSTHISQSLLWRHNGHDGVLNHQPHNCLLNSSFRRRSKKTSKLSVTGLCLGNSPMTEFPAQRASNVENFSIWWSNHGNPGSYKVCLPCTHHSTSRCPSSSMCFYWSENIIQAGQCPNILWDFGR